MVRNGSNGLFLQNQTVNAFKQLDSYSCGPSALAFFLFALGRKFTIARIRKELKPTKENGTSHEAIERMLHRRRIDFESKSNAAISDLKPPSLVNYQYLGEGHYGVILSVTQKYISLFEPWFAKTHLYTRKAFERQWHSNRYGRRWAVNAL